MLKFSGDSLNMIRNIYKLEKIANKYHTDRLSSGFRKYKHWIECNYLKKSTDMIKDPVHEVGCGTGRITECLYNLGLNPTVSDNSAAMLEVFNKRMSKQKNIEPILADITNLPFHNGKFSSIVSIRVIWHLSQEEVELALEELSRVTKDCLVFDITNKHYRESLFGKIILWIFSIRNVTQNSLYLDEDEISKTLKTHNFILHSKFNLESVPHLWLNLWPTSKIPRFFFEIARLIDKFFLFILPPQRQLLLYTRNK